MGSIFGSLILGNNHVKEFYRASKTGNPPNIGPTKQEYADTGRYIATRFLLNSRGSLGNMEKMDPLGVVGTGCLGKHRVPRKWGSFVGVPVVRIIL